MDFTDIDSKDINVPDPQFYTRFKSRTSWVRHISPRTDPSKGFKTMLCLVLDLPYLQFSILHLVQLWVNF